MSDVNLSSENQEELKGKVNVDERPITDHVISPNYTGRTIIYSPYKSEELNQETIKTILKDTFLTHIKNSKEIETLHKYFKGDQPINRKIKKIRPDINNKVKENTAFQIVEFKKGYIFGDPVKYIQSGEVANKEIAQMNRYMNIENKYSKDMELAEWFYIAGTSYRMILPTKEASSLINKEISPFNLYTLNPKNTFVVYSSYYDHEPLIGVTYTDVKENNKQQRIFFVYSKNKYYEFKQNISDVINEITNIKEENHILGAIPIIEYPLNPNRLGVIEIVWRQLDALNNLTSTEIDDVQQFVQSLLVFVNQEVDVDTFLALKTVGAIQIASAEPSKPADVKMLTSNLNYADTKILYDRIYDNILSIVGIPRMNDKPSGGDTGQARLLGEGWTTAEMRAKQDILSFVKSEKEMLRIVLKICKSFANSNIEKLELVDMEVKCLPNKSDNLLVKAQALLNMKQAEIPPKIAIPACGLFADANEVVKQGETFFGQEWWKKVKVETNDKKIDEPNESNEQKEIK